MAYLLAATAAFVNALTSVLQRIGVETAPESTTLRLSLMTHAIRRGIWLIGFGLMLVVFGLQATALRFGELSVVQPVLTTELLFLLLILGGWFRFRLTLQEWLGALTVVVGLGGFFLAAAPSGGQAIPDTAQWVVASAVLLGIIAACIVAALRGPRWWRAAAFGAAAAVTGGYTAALTKAITNYTKLGWGHVFTHFQPYMLAVMGLGTVFLLQNALACRPDHGLADHARNHQPTGEHRARSLPVRRPAAGGPRMDRPRGVGAPRADGRGGRAGPIATGGRGAPRR